MIIDFVVNNLLLLVWFSCGITAVILNLLLYSKGTMPFWCKVSLVFSGVIGLVISAVCFVLFVIFDITRKG